MIYGNVEGVRNSYLDELETLYDLKVDKTEILNEELVVTLTRITSIIEREISVLINRRGVINSIYIGDCDTVELPIINIKEKKLSGMRIIHTHPNGNSRLSVMDKSALIKLKLDAMVAIGVKDGEFNGISIGFIDVVEDTLSVHETSNISIKSAINYNFLDKVNYIENEIIKNEYSEEASECAILVGCEDQKCLEELEELAEACGVKVLHSVFQNIKKIDPSFYVGSGKVSEIFMLRQSLDANLVIFDDELSGSQVRNLESELGCKVIDRTTLILEIFSKRAKTREGKIQVELAQLKYRLPRLMGLGTVLSRTGGGIGTRGPGEKKLETDRRHIKERIYDLNKELERAKEVRSNQREKRNKDNITKISLVGYTNAGKSTLRNMLYNKYAPKENKIKEEVFVKNMLFATLETTTRAIVLPNNKLVTLTDTVGFIRKLPHDLVEAFKSTLEEVIFSDILIHVIDISSEDATSQLKACEDVIREIGAANIPIILVFNKIDKCSEEFLNENIKNVLNEATLNYLTNVKISSTKELNIDELIKSIEENLPEKFRVIDVLIPYDDSSFAAFVHRNGRVINEEFKDEGNLMCVEVDDELYNKCKKYILVVKDEL